MADGRGQRTNVFKKFIGNAMEATRQKMQLLNAKLGLKTDDYKEPKPGRMGGIRKHCHRASTRYANLQRAR